MLGKGFPGTDDPKHEGNVSDSEFPENPSGTGDVSLVSDDPPVSSANDPEAVTINTSSRNTYHLESVTSVRFHAQ